MSFVANAVSVYVTCLVIIIAIISKVQILSKALNTLQRT